MELLEEILLEVTGKQILAAEVVVAVMQPLVLAELVDLVL
jgi:hypothetical protein